MKKIVLAAAFAGAASTAFAGNLSDPIPDTPIDDIITTTEASSSAKGVIIPLIIVALVAAAVAAD